MRRTAHIAGGLLICAVLCSAADARKVILTATGYRVIPHETTTSYVTPGYSNTNCWGSGTYWGSSAAANVNCSTVTMPPQQRSNTIRQIEVFNQLVADGMIYTLRCTANWVGSNCSWLLPEEKFEAELKDTTVWITARQGGNMGKQVRIKFQLLDLRPAPPASSPTVGLGSDLDQFMEEARTFTPEIAEREIGAPISRRYVFDSAQNIAGETYAYASPTPEFQRVELMFDIETGHPTSVAVFPAALSWADCVRVWGDNVQPLTKADGTEIRRYLDRRVNVLLDGQDRVISVTLY